MLRLFWSVCPWWCWFGIALLVPTLLGSMAWLWLDVTGREPSGRTAAVLMASVLLGLVLTAAGIGQQSCAEDEPMSCREAAPATLPWDYRVGLLRWLQQRRRERRALKQLIGKLKSR